MDALVKISEYEIEQNLLLDQKWKKADYYKLCCKSELWGCAFFITLDKQLTPVPNKAIIYILEKLVIESEGWNEEIQSDINGDFRKFVFAEGYLSDDTGWDISINEFWTNYEEIKNGICNESDFQITKNGTFTKELLIERHEILSVICFVNKWNNRQYFIECHEKWAFFSWATSA